MIFYSIYTSRPRVPMTLEVLEEITARSIENNQRDDITGMLLGIENRYLQYLEGPEEKVNDLLEKIRVDGRHHEMVVWLKGHTDDRVFREWSMGSWMLDAEKLKHLSALSDLKKFLRNPEHDELNSNRFIAMMNGLLKTWIANEPERAEWLKH